MALAQNVLIVAIIFQSLNFISASLAHIRLEFATQYYSFAAVTAVISASLTIAALLIVRSAPVYDSVGLDIVPVDGPDEDPFVPIYEEGVVPVMGVAQAMMLYFATVCFAVAGFISFRNKPFEAEEALVDSKKEGDIKEDTAAVAVTL